MLSGHVKAGKYPSFTSSPFPHCSAHQEQLHPSPSRGWWCQVALTEDVALAQHPASASLCTPFAALATERQSNYTQDCRAEQGVEPPSLGAASVCPHLERDTRNAWAPLSPHCSLTLPVPSLQHCSLSSQHAKEIVAILQSCPCLSEVE